MQKREVKNLEFYSIEDSVHKTVVGVIAGNGFLRIIGIFISNFKFDQCIYI